MSVHYLLDVDLESQFLDCLALLETLGDAIAHDARDEKGRSRFHQQLAFRICEDLGNLIDQFGAGKVDKPDYREYRDLPFSPDWRAVVWHRGYWILPITVPYSLKWSFITITPDFGAFGTPDCHKRTGLPSVEAAIAAGKAEIDESLNQLQREQAAAA